MMLNVLKFLNWITSYDSMQFNGVSGMHGMMESWKWLDSGEGWLLDLELNPTLILTDLQFAATNLIHLASDM